MVFTDAGIAIPERLAQLSNALAPISVKPFPKVTVVKLITSRKAASPIEVTLSGNTTLINVVFSILRSALPVKVFLSFVTGTSFTNSGITTFTAVSSAPIATASVSDT